MCYNAFPLVMTPLAENREGADLHINIKLTGVMVKICPVSRQ